MPHGLRGVKAVGVQEIAAVVQKATCQLGGSFDTAADGWYMGALPRVGEEDSGADASPPALMQPPVGRQKSVLSRRAPGHV